MSGLLFYVGRPSAAGHGQSSARTDAAQRTQPLGQRGDGVYEGGGASDDKGDMLTRAGAELALAVETGGEVDQASQSAFMAGVEPQAIAALGGLPIRLVLEILGQRETS